MSNFSFIKFSQKLGVSDLWNLVEPLGESMLLNKVLCMRSFSKNINYRLLRAALLGKNRKRRLNG